MENDSLDLNPLFELVFFNIYSQYPPHDLNVIERSTIFNELVREAGLIMMISKKCKNLDICMRKFNQYAILKSIDMKKDVSDIENDLGDIIVSYFNDSIKICSIFSSIYRYFGLENHILGVVHEFENSLKLYQTVFADQLIQFNVFDISEIISDFLDEKIRKTEKENEDLSKTMLSLKFKSHICVDCSNSLAISFAMPCRHCALCNDCLYKRSKVKSPYNICLRCHQKVEFLYPIKNM